jgi:hypothetical protein
VRRDVLTFLLFVVIATLVWYGHAMQSVRNTRVPVLIQYTGKPDAIGLKAPGLPDTVMIEVRDAGARLNTYHRDPLRLTIDLHSYIHGEKGRIYIPSDALRRSISDILQGTSRLIETQPEDITCDFFTEQEKSVLLEFRGDLKTANEYQIIGQPTLARKRMKIFGDEKTLSAIDTLYTEPQDLSEVSDTMRVRCALEVPQGVRAEEDSVELCIIAERFTEKKFTIPVHIKGVPEGYHIRLFPKEVEVSVRVGMNHFSQVKANDIHASCAYSPERNDKLAIEISCTNPYITAAWAYPGVVEFILEQ